MNLATVPEYCALGLHWLAFQLVFRHGNNYSKGVQRFSCLWISLVAAASSNPIYGLPDTTAAATVHPRNSTETPHISATPIVYGESALLRTVYTVVSLICLSLLTGMLGYRARQLEPHHLRSLSLTRVLVLVLYCLAICFVASAAVVESGLGLSSSPVCNAAIIICLAFYVGSKVTMYVFLVERAHALRAPYMKRSRDWIWLGGMLTIACGFGSIAICGFVWPVARLSQHDGRCHIGLPWKVTIPLLSFDVIINILLTAIFIYLLRPLLRSGGVSNEAEPASRFTKGLQRILKSSSSIEICPANRNFLKSIEKLLWKSFIGSVLVMLPTVGNLAALVRLQGQELGWLCLTACSFDVTWAVCVIHWLTLGSTEIDERPLTLQRAGLGPSGTSSPETSDPKEEGLLSFEEILKELPRGL